MTRAKKIIAAAASLVLALTAQPSKALCAETHTVTIIDFNGKVMTTLTVPHGSPVDFSKIDISSLEYHIDGGMFVVSKIDISVKEQDILFLIFFPEW